MLEQIALGVLLMAVVTFVHAACTFLAFSVLRQLHVDRWGLDSGFTSTLVIASVVAILFGAALLEALVWAATYRYVGALSTLEEALYFSIVTYTTLGFGEITLNEQWRLLASLEAATGIILFGWSTALVFAFVQRIIQLRHSQESRG